MGLDDLVAVESNNKKRVKLNDDDEEDDIDLSKGEDRERHVAIQEGKKKTIVARIFILIIN